MLFFSSFLVYQSSTGTPIPMSISPAKQTSASLEWLLLPPLTATWAWSLDGETTWSHLPTFSYISFVALYLGSICLDHRASSSTNNKQSQGNCAVVFQQSSLLFSNISLSFKEILDYWYICDLFNGLSSWEGLEGGMAFDWDRADDVQPWDQVSNVPCETPIVQLVCRQPPKCHEGYVLFFSDIICIMLMSSYIRLRQGVVLTAMSMWTFW